MVLVAVGWVMPKSTAALEKLPDSTTRMKRRLLASRSMAHLYTCRPCEGGATSVLLPMAIHGDMYTRRSRSSRRKAFLFDLLDLLVVRRLNDTASSPGQRGAAMPPRNSSYGRHRSSAIALRPAI